MSQVLQNAQQENKAITTDDPREKRSFLPTSLNSIVNTVAQDPAYLALSGLRDSSYSMAEIEAGMNAARAAHASSQAAASAQIQAALQRPISQLHAAHLSSNGNRNSNQPNTQHAQTPQYMSQPHPIQPTPQQIALASFMSESPQFAANASLGSAGHPGLMASNGLIAQPLGGFRRPGYQASAADIAAAEAKQSTATALSKKLEAKRNANRLHAKQSRKRKKDFTDGLKEQTELLQKTKAYLEILPVIILAHNQEGIITHAIAATKRLLDYSATELCGMDFYRILRKDYVGIARNACQPFLDDGSDCSGSSTEDQSVKVSLKKRNGEELMFEMETKRPSRDEILRYLQVAKSNISSSSSSSSEDGCRPNSNTSSMGTSTSFYESSEDGARSTFNDGSTSTNDGTNGSPNASNDGGSNDGNGSNEDNVTTDTTFCKYTNRGGNGEPESNCRVDHSPIPEDELISQKRQRRSRNGPSPVHSSSCTSVLPRA